MPDENKREGINRAAADALERAKRNQLPHPVRGAAKRRAQREKSDADEHEPAPAVKIREVAEERRGERGGEHVGREDPAVELQSAELPDDRRQRRADVGRVDREKKADEQDAGYGGGVAGSERCL